MPQPTSLTATIHVSFHYAEPEKEAEKEPVTASQVTRLSQILEDADNLDPDMMRILCKFATYLEGIAVNGTSQ